MSSVLVRLLTIVTLVLVFSFLFALPTKAYDPLGATCDDAAQGSDFCNSVSQDQNRTIVYGNKNLFVRIIQVIVMATGAISLVMIIVGGLKYIISAGDSNATKSAKDTILYAIIGLFVAIFAQVIVAFVLSRFVT